VADHSHRYSSPNQGLSKGSNIPTVGNVSISWHSPSSKTASATGMPAQAAGSGALAAQDEPMHETMHEDEDELPSADWGAGAEVDLI
jgi:hypothetical protein